MEITLDKFKPRDYQRSVIKAFEQDKYKRLLLCWPRRAGKDILWFNLLLRAAIARVAIYYYIFPTFAQAKRAIWDSITNDGDRFLDFIPPQIIKSSNSQEMKITLINNSIIQLVGSDNYASLRGTNPQGIVFSEYAWQDPEAYITLRPILVANDGWAAFISCVNPNTLVISTGGLRRIGTLSSSRAEYTPFNEDIFGLGGFHNAEQFYYGGKQETLKITLQSGYELECTPVHPIWHGS